MIARTPELAATARPLTVERRRDLEAEWLHVRGQRWWRLKDPIRLKFWQFGEEEYFLWSQLEAGVSLDELQRQFAERFAPRRIEISHLHQFLGTLHREGLVFSTAPDQASVLLDRNERQRMRDRYQWLTNLLAIRFRGLDPTKFLEWLYPRVAWLFAPWAFMVLAVFIASAVLLAVSQLDSILARLPRASDFLTVTNLAWLALTLGIVKACHELGHALTCRHFGGRCHELGVMILVFSPCLYCNVSDAWLLPSRWRRMAISAAGMCVELVLAAAATWLWWFSEPGLVSTLCLNVMVVGSINTLLFNGNPLLRFDGYFLLSDYLEQPNLRQASDEWLSDWLGRVLLGIESSTGRMATGFQPFLLPTYALAAAAYRWLLTVFVWWFVYHWLSAMRLSILGAALVFASAAMMLGQILWHRWATWGPAWQDGRARSGRAAISLVATLVALAMVGLVPLPRQVTAPAVIRPADAATIYVSLPGRLLKSVRPGARVSSGDPLAWLRNEELERDLLRLENERDVLKRQVEILTRQQVQDTRTGVGSAAGQLRTTEQQLADVEARCEQRRADREQLTLRAPRDGVVLAARPQRSTSSKTELQRWQGTPLDPENVGCYLESGEVVCLVGEPNHCESLAIVEQSNVECIQPGQLVSVQVNELPRADLAGTVDFVAELSTLAPPAELVAQHLLPVSTAFDEPRLAGTHYQVKVVLNAGPAVPFGAAGWASIRVAPQTVAERIYASLCRTFRW